MGCFLFDLLKDFLLKMLDTDETVRRKVVEVAGSQQLSSVGREGACSGSGVAKDDMEARLRAKAGECDALRKELAETKNDFKRKAGDLEREQQLRLQLEEQSRAHLKELGLLQEKIQKLEDKCREMQVGRDALQERTAELERMIQPFQAAFEQYKALSPKTRELLRGIFPREDIWDFVFCGTREDNLASLWNFCADAIKNGGDDFKELSELFDFFLQWNHRQYGKPKYKRLDLAEGEEFNENTAQRDRESVPQGKINSVLFQGYAFAANNKVVCKSIVHVV